MDAERYGYEYDECRNWINKKSSKGCSREDLLLGAKKDENELKNFLYQQMDNNEWPPMIVSEWQSFVNEYLDLQERSKSVNIPPLDSVPNTNDKTEPVLAASAWQLYKKRLIEEKHFSIASVENIKYSALTILNFLQDGKRKNDDGVIGPVKGMVVGNVQSGKTANMGGLMTMAADYGWNMFIILTGTIENLRVQTQQRFIHDMPQNGNLTWISFDHPGADATSKLAALNLSEGSKVCYLVCCLKNSKRLKKLERWLNSDANKKKQFKVLLIDDEADQASLNTHDIDDEAERTAINRCIQEIVNDTKSRSKTKFLAMNYVGYTATPYGNFLNESGEKSLFPRDFISILEPSDLYFGPQQIFGENADDGWPGMPIINYISGTYKHGEKEASGDIDMMNACCETGDKAFLPESLKEAISWFCVAVAILRCYKSKDPVTMLIHHTMKTDSHSQLGMAIKNWLNSLSGQDFLLLCQNVYKVQTKKLSKEVFKVCCAKYGQLSNISLDMDISDYPPFENLHGEIKKLRKRVEHIYLDGDEILNYHEGINLCIDNCKNESITGQEDCHVRLVYPKDHDHVESYAPAFLVIGGNTLSRGLTLEGLVCTYFSRDVKQADSLMQMGRWFGYRRGYELLPRVWLTDVAEQRFEFLTELDSDLRLDLQKYCSQISPLEAGPLIKNTPGASFLSITNKNKSQSMIEAEINFAGANLQTVNFVNDQDVLARNLDIADKFIKSLGIPDPELTARSNGKRHVWLNVSFDDIWDNLLSSYEGRMTSLDNKTMLRQWIMGLSQENSMGNWDVVLSGIQGKKADPNKIWNGVGKIERTRRKSGMHQADSMEFCIGTLSDPQDWMADLDVDAGRKKIADDDWKMIMPHNEKADKRKADVELAKSHIREALGKGKVPLLVLYCIDKNSMPQPNAKNRAPLHTVEDVIGLYVRIPGQRVNKKMSAKVTINFDKQEFE